MAFLQSLSGLPWAASLGALLQIALIDVTLASDNAVAVGMAASGLPTPQRHFAMVLGLSGAVVLLCVLAVFAINLLKAGGGGLILGGGLLLLLVGWQMWRDLRANEPARHGHRDHPSKPKTLLRALVLIFLADMSTSLDNVLAVAGVARNQPDWVLFIGLALSVALTGFAAVGVAKLLHRWPWIGYIGLLVVLYVAVRMVLDGAVQLKWL
ncbi:MAG TPA: YjbE family putative metal transport protein [Caulobacteraceae bacterium]|jgi:YjbE family integral membrane protein|nr:YjbE family putative metal transport protein [Caulobacteraceae bacterium]